jgi:hypothetical protein
MSSKDNGQQGEQGHKTTRAINRQQIQRAAKTPDNKDGMGQQRSWVNLATRTMTARANDDKDTGQQGQRTRQQRGERREWEWANFIKMLCNQNSDVLYLLCQNP